ncbi:hypothetical protein NMY22_g18614 [Coprinellus aureogranulatus]|nr:hypothetical protein NMY22_g18614 [Coprinellus aureogranulatus]
MFGLFDFAAISALARQRFGLAIIEVETIWASVDKGQGTEGPLDQRQDQGDNMEFEVAINAESGLLEGLHRLSM